MLLRPLQIYIPCPLLYNMKDKIRDKMLEKRLSLSLDQVKEKSEKIRNFLTSLSAFQDTKTILLYLPIKNEPDTYPLMESLIQEGKTVCLPISTFETKEITPSRVMDPKIELQHTEYGILEPSEEFVRVMDRQQLDCVIVPGIAFDSTGHRLGYGQGFYDQFLAKLSKKVLLIGLAYEQQIIKEIPVQEHDRSVHKLVTEQRVIDTSQ